MFMTQRDLKLLLWIFSPRSHSSNNAVMARGSNASRSLDHNVNLTDAGQEFLFKEGLIFEFEYEQGDEIHCDCQCGQCTRPLVVDNYPR